MTSLEEALNILEILNDAEPIIPTVIEEPKRNHRVKKTRDAKYQERANFVKRHNLTDGKAADTLIKAQRVQTKTYRRKH